MTEQEKELNTEQEKAENTSPECEKPQGAPAEEPADDRKKRKKDKEKEKLQKELEAAEEKFKAELKAQKEMLLRTAAEFDNYRKRTEREKLQSVRIGTAAAVEKLLPSLDNLERAAEADSADADYKKGVTMTLGSFRTALEAIGVEEIKSEGQPFDPIIHSAIAQQESELDSGLVVSVMQKGYRLGDRVIRPAMVVVSK